MNKYKKTGRRLIPVIALADTLPEIPRGLIEPFGDYINILARYDPYIF